MRVRYPVALGLAVALAVPAVAGAATKTVTLGMPPKAGKVLQNRFSADANRFYRGTVTIHEGDSVRFLPFGFHTASFPKRGGRGAPPLIVPGATVTGSNDAAGAPFWFNGQPALGLNPAHLKSGFGKTFRYTGAKAVNSGLPLSNKPKAMTVKFPKKGVFPYFCAVHPGMKGKVRVEDKSEPIPSARADARAVRNQIKKDTATAKKLAGTDAPANTVLLGAAADRGVEFFGMLPDRLTVPVGTTVTFRLPTGSTEVHTATFGPGDPIREPNSYLGQIASSIQGVVFDPRATYPSEPPGTTAALTPSLHGNGFWNSGFMDATKAVPLPSQARLTVAQAGTYTFFCMIHPFMKGTVIAQ